MRRYAFPFSVILLFFIMLSFPQEVFNGASEGLLLWFQIVLPTLLPFIIISNVLIQTNSISILSRIFGPAFQKFFHISIDGSFVVLAGFLCGYPMGAKVTSDQTLLFPSLVILFASPILCSFVFRNIYKKDLSTKRAGKTSISSCIHFNFEIVDTCIMDGFETITKVGGYIILFSVLLSLLQMFPVKSAFISNICLPMLEITNGIPMLSKNILSQTEKYVSILALTSFGGLCSVAQTKSMIRQSGLSIVPYILEKLVTALVTSLLAFFYITLIH